MYLVSLKKMHWKKCINDNDVKPSIDFFSCQENNCIIVNDEVLVLKLRDVAKVSAGYPFRGSFDGKSAQGDSCLVVQMKDINEDGLINWAECSKANVVLKGKSSWLADGDVLFAAKGRSNYAAVVNKAEFDENAKVVASPHFYVISKKNASVTPEYITWWLNKLPSQRYFVRNSEGSVTKSIRRAVLEDVEIVVPSLDKQKSIVALNQSFIAQKRALESLIQNAESMENAIAGDLLAPGQDDLFSG